MLFKTLTQKYGVGREQFLQYQQPSQLIEELMNINNFKKLTSQLYTIIANLNTKITLPTAKWETDLAFPPNPDYWEQICENTFTMSDNTNLQLIQYKVNHRTHITQSKMFKMGLANTDICSQCTLGGTYTYLHTIWLCQPVHSFWITVTETLSTILSYRIPASPTLCLLGDISEIHIPQKHRNPLLISLVVAKKVVLQNWKSKKSCHINNWTNLISEYISMKKYNAHRKKQI